MDQTEHFDITVTPDEARAIRERVESGAYASADEVVRAALRALQRSDAVQAERMTTLRQTIQNAIDDPGPRYTADEIDAFIDELERSDGGRRRIG